MRHKRPAKPVPQLNEPPNQTETAELAPTVTIITVGWRFRLASCWVGAHWSPYNRRLCINLLPCITVWFTWPGGHAPK